jgi:hypothetical protein
MQRHTFIRYIRCVLMVGTVAICVLGCSTPLKMSPNHLASIGVVDGAMYWEAEQKLASEGYQCVVTGAKRENFDCTKTVGFFPTCLLRVEFVADDKNLVSHLRTANPACMGTP